MADQEAEIDAEALADEFVETVGWEEASRLIQARKPKNKRGMIARRRHRRCR
jgi:hypothetical protein